MYMQAKLRDNEEPVATSCDLELFTDIYRLQPSYNDCGDNVINSNISGGQFRPVQFLIRISSQQQTEKGYNPSRFVMQMMA
uniref:CUB domain-containing protein n=1 Tax=Setaria digitata TaxID=48799 RepID=A0A915Q7H7_9BILA